jgi:mono/diheme cytochrome c family protein
MSRNRVLFVSLLLVSSACAVRSITPGDAMEVNMDFDLAALDMRHGWAFLTPPKLTYVGTNDKESVQRGKALFSQHCQKCHGTYGRGNGPLAKKLTQTPANLQTITNDITNTYLVVQINQGKGDMPQWQDFLSQEQTYDLTNYIRTLKDKEKASKGKDPSDSKK